MGLAGLARFALGEDFARVLVERLGLRNQVDGFFQLYVILQLHFVAIIQAEERSEYFALDLPLQPDDVCLNIRVGVFDVLLVQKLAEFRR